MGVAGSLLCTQLRSNHARLGRALTTFAGWWSHGRNGAVSLQAIWGLVSIGFFKNAATSPAAIYQQQIPVIVQGLEANFAATSEQYARQALLTPEASTALTTQIVAAYTSNHYFF